MPKDYDELVQEMEREMQRLADQAFAGLVKLSEGPERFWRPRADVFETEDHVLVIVEVAGLSRERYRIELAEDDSSVLIRGVRMELAADRSGRQRCHQLEIYFGPFERNIPLPEGLTLDRENIEASYQDGMLRIILPRLRQRPARRRASERNSS